MAIEVISLVKDRNFVSLTIERSPTSMVNRRKRATTLGIVMPQGPDFGDMDVGETVNGAMDFAPWLAPGVVIATIVSVVALNYVPSGGAAYVTLTGTPQVGTAPISEGGSGNANTAVIQPWIGENPGTARITFTITTTDGQTLIGWAHQEVDQPN